MDKTMIKKSQRVLSFLLCLVILFTVTIANPMNQARAVVPAIPVIILLGLSILTACGIQFADENGEAFKESIPDEV